MKKVLSVILVFIMLMSTLTIMSSAASNPYPINNYNSSGEWSNCTWSVWKLVYDNLGVALPAWGNAGSWYSNAQNSGYSVGSAPQVNSIICYEGHVAFVTGISSDGSKVYIKEGGYGYDPNKGYHEGYTNAYGSREYSGQPIYGYIYLTNQGEMTYPTISTNKDIFFLGDTVDISWEKTSPNTDFYQYWLVIEDPAGQAVCNFSPGDAGDVDKNTFSFKCTLVGDYKIAVWAVPYNNKAERQKFDVRYVKAVEKIDMTQPTIYFDKEQYYLNDTVNISWKATAANTDFYQYWLVIEGPNGQLINNSATGDAGDVSKNYFSFKATMDGTYKISVWSVPYNEKAQRQKFESTTIDVKTSIGETMPEPDTENNCDCMCHKIGFAKIIFVIVRLFWKLFGSNEICACGAEHY